MSKSRWIGPPVYQDERRALYKSCEIESGETVSLGDYVYMLPKDPSLELFIARIESLYEADEAKSVQVRWLYRQSDLKHSPPAAPRENEVFFTNYYDCQLIQSIVGPCQIVTDCSTQPISRKLEDNSRAVHICRYSYSEESGVFMDVEPTDSDHQNLSLNDDPGELADEDVNADAKDLAQMLIQIERSVHSETSSAMWSAKRMAWMQNVKAVTNLEEVKEALLDLEDGYHIFPNQTSWQESIHAVQSSDMLLQCIKDFSHEMQIKENVLNYAKPEVNSLNKSRPGFSYRKKHKRKRGTPLLNSPVSEKPVSQDSFICKSIYEIDHRSLPPDAPEQLKHLRAALVNATTKENVTIVYPSMASLEEYFEALSMSSDGKERIITRCLFNQLPASTCTMPRFDEEFSMAHEIARRVLKGIITSTEYLQHNHLESFWLIPSLVTSGSKTETQANKDENCCNAKEIDLSSPNQTTIKKHRPSEKNSPIVLKVYKNNEIWRGKTQESSLDKYRRLSGSKSYGKQNDCNKSMHKKEVPTPLDAADCRDSPPLQHTLDSNPGCVLAVDCEQKSQNDGALDENQGIVKWGVRKKITSRCRNNTFSDDSRSKGFCCKANVHKQHEHEVARTGHGSNGNNHFVVTQIHTSNGKGKSLKVPKLMEGRWSSERYNAAQLKLFEIMKDKGAVPGKPLLRPALRVEARKHIGDTGLLDHLLKHMTDTVINGGERFRRRHNSEGAMEYWLEDARLQELRRQAGVDQYWIPPPGWKVGDAITDSKNEGMSLSHLTELKHLRQEVEKLKSQLQYVCQHVSVSLSKPTGALTLDCESDFQSLKSIEESVTKQAQEMKEELHRFRQMFDCHNYYLQRSSITKHSEEETDRVACYRIPPIENNCMKGLSSGDKDKVTVTQDSHPTLQPRSVSQANIVTNKTEKGEAHETRRMSISKAFEKGESKRGDEISFFCKAARRWSLGKPGEAFTTARQGNLEKKSPVSAVLRRSPHNAATKEDESKENLAPVEQQGDLTKAYKKAFQGWKKTQSITQRHVLSAQSANVRNPLESLVIASD